MANKQITVVYQDCPLCGDRGRAVKQIVAEKGIRLHKVSFASDEGRSLIHTAVFEHGIGTMPFYTDGTKFSTSLADLVEKPRKKTSKKASKKAKIDEGAENGDVAEA